MGNHRAVNCGEPAGWPAAGAEEVTRPKRPRGGRGPLRRCRTSTCRAAGGSEDPSSVNARCRAPDSTRGGSSRRQGGRGVALRDWRRDPQSGRVRRRAGSLPLYLRPRSGGAFLERGLVGSESAERRDAYRRQDPLVRGRGRDDGSSPGNWSGDRPPGRLYGCASCLLRVSSMHGQAHHMQLTHRKELRSRESRDLCSTMDFISRFVPEQCHRSHLAAVCSRVAPSCMSCLRCRCNLWHRNVKYRELRQALLSASIPLALVRVGYQRRRNPSHHYLHACQGPARRSATMSGARPGRDFVRLATCLAPPGPRRRVEALRAKQLPRGPPRLVGFDDAALGVLHVGQSRRQGQGEDDSRRASPCGPSRGRSRRGPRPRRCACQTAPQAQQHLHTQSLMADTTRGWSWDCKSGQAEDQPPGPRNREAGSRAAPARRGATPTRPDLLR